MSYLYARSSDDVVPGLHNSTILKDDCTLKTCSLDYAHVKYDPNLAGNALFLAIFAVILPIQILLGVRYKTWGFLGGMIGGVGLEIIGYVARVQMHYNPFKDEAFQMYLICLTIAPAFLSASIYLCLARIVVVYGEGLSRIRPRTYTILFITCDFISLVLQAAGGGLAATANTKSADWEGIHIMIAGLAFQVASLALFLLLCAEFAWRVHRAGSWTDPSFASLRSTFKWKGFLVALFIATITIFARSIFRVAELAGGFHGKLANEEIPFMILEGAMIVIACLFLTAFHPGFVFGKDNWHRANFQVRSKKGQGESLEQLGTVGISKEPVSSEVSERGVEPDGTRY